MNDRNTSAAEAAFRDAVRQVGLAYALGRSLDLIAQREHDHSAWLLSEASTDDGQQYASQYSETADSLIADLRSDEVAARTEQPATGTPHPDKAMADRGWTMGRTGVYVKGEFDAPEPAGGADVAALERYASSLHQADREAV